MMMILTTTMTMTMTRWYDADGIYDTTFGRRLFTMDVCHECIFKSECLYYQQDQPLHISTLIYILPIQPVFVHRIHRNL